MTLGELIKDKELPVRVCFKDNIERNFIYFEVRYVLDNKAYGHYFTKEDYNTSTQWPLYSEAFELYKEPKKKKTITLKKYQVTYKHYDCGYLSNQQWAESEEYINKFYNNSAILKYLEGHDIEIEVDN